MNSIEILRYSLILSTILLVNNVRARLEGEGIVGGDDAREGDFGYQISFQVFDRPWCGGGIIAERYIVTAAHCVVDIDNKFTDYLRLSVVAGISDLLIESARNVRIDVEEIFVPSEYNRRIRVNPTADIAVLKLKKNFDLKKRSYLRKLKLPNPDKTYTNVTAMVTGFGANEVDITVNPETNNEEVADVRYFGKMRYARVFVEEDQGKILLASIVQRDPSKPEGICGGDSGSPLVYGNTVIGIVSGGAGDCRDDRQAAIYTGVAPFVNFVRKVLGGNIDKDVRHVTLKNLR